MPPCYTFVAWWNIKTYWSWSGLDFWTFILRKAFGICTKERLWVWVGCEPASNVGDESKLHQFTRVTIKKYITSCDNSSGGATLLHCNKTKKHSSKCFSHVERQDQEGNLGFFSASGETCPTFKYFPRRRHCHQLDRHLWHVLKRKKHSTTSMFCCWLVCHWCDQTAGDLYHGRCSRKAISISGASAVSWKHNCDEMPSSTEQSESDHLSHHICNDRFHPRPKN